MKKLILICLVAGTQFCIAGEKENENKTSENSKKETNPVMCYTRRAASGTYGQANYNSVTVTRFATSDISYQDAQARACVLADASAEKALSISQSTNESLTIGG
ncbi:hypothetical protein GN157_17150 [Flavobacterium rakeshii]|uniref:Uncharacterized protein n=1 Tax=Flavobacterium rakeshii TaxID=1038845 RepID=A0A6N8HIF1_9FLAO|nr:hypothetical protein [Flavobacterium rakeshii]MUV05443.1 hypothetical protein [Flavobacterium rakeshii]